MKNIVFISPQFKDGNKYEFVGVYFLATCTCKFVHALELTKIKRSFGLLDRIRATQSLCVLYH